MKLAEWIKKSTTEELRALAQIEKEVPRITPKRVVTKAEVRPDVWNLQQEK